MCYRLVERFSVCRCVYYEHSIDMCAAANQHGHRIQEKTILVGYLCGHHSDQDTHQSSSFTTGFTDSAYASRDSHHRSPPGAAAWRSFPLALFELKAWAVYLFSFRRRHSSVPPSGLTRLFAPYHVPASMP
ncbi:hypothetical protein VC83_03029 [Pseudogymnoascus destructans]|uniref:Uncharacterized protein n=1 Tax=Pseudogymnoascus destructans TaxID=655981 RepID=A0A177ADM5_9PEZI|nr:uncharacterized protein VC83_03029 [Pseudogymnoascus destructans]OAF59900.1 hypothetical protein VC83_03029 [Pseudogymnoascus destructans]